MRSLLLLTTLLVPLRLGMAWSAKYAVDCPEHCDSTQCRSSLRCRRTVLDDCGCCQVCAAGPGETCYRTVSGMDGVKCGPGLKCHFYSEEDDFGDEFGICKGKEQLLCFPLRRAPGGRLVGVGGAVLLRTTGEDARMQVVCSVESGICRGRACRDDSQGCRTPLTAFRSEKESCSGSLRGSFFWEAVET